MPITCDDLKNFAAALAVAGSDETQIRAAISRAYYAGFHASLPLAEKMPPSKSARIDARHVTHEELTSRLHEWKTESIHPGLGRLRNTGGALARALASARAARVKADYRLGVRVMLSEATAQVVRTKNILRAVTQIENEMNRSSGLSVQG